MCMFRGRIEHQILIYPFCFSIPVCPSRTALIPYFFHSNLFWEKLMIFVYQPLTRILLSVLISAILSQSILTEEQSIVYLSVTLNDFCNRLYRTSLIWQNLSLSLLKTSYVNYPYIFADKVNSNFLWAMFSFCGNPY